MSQQEWPDGSVLECREASVLGSGTFGVVIGTLRCHARSEGARADRFAAKLVLFLQQRADYYQRLREISTMNALKASGDNGNVVVATRVFLHK